MDAMDQVPTSAMSVYHIPTAIQTTIIVNARLAGVVMTVASTKVDVIPCVNPRKVAPVRLLQIVTSA